MERKNRTGVRLLKSNIIRDNGMPLAYPMLGDWITFTTVMYKLKPYILYDRQEVEQLIDDNDIEKAFDEINNFLKSIAPRGFRFGVKDETIGFWKK